VMDGKFHLFYGMQDPSGTYYRTNLATSENGTDWNTYDENPILTEGNISSFNPLSGTIVDVVSHQGILVGLTLGIPLRGIETDENYQVGLALSIDGKEWIRYPASSVLWPGYEGWENGHIDQAELLSWRGNLYILYTAKPNRPRRIGLVRAVLDEPREGYFKNDARGRWNGVSIDAGESTYGIPTKGYDSITIKFLSDTVGLLDVETQEPDLDWRTLLDDQSISANTLKEINLGGLQRGVRLTFDTAATVSAWYELR